MSVRAFPGQSSAASSQRPAELLCLSKASSIATQAMTPCHVCHALV